ncbi:hypothetical protein [Oceanobacillus sp. FSL H7-0719]|uniref:hypothetical protein n=1 Tax=Oceanobacillus sp. FSL H7-0719 TaxID=2954507 RepID=UPI003254F15C
MKNVNEIINQLKGIESEQDKQVIKEGLSKMFKELGYGAISEEIANNRKAKSNALYGLDMYYKSAASDRYNTNGEIIYSHTTGYMDRLNSFRDAAAKIINTFLTDGTDSQQEYLKLMDQYNNEYFRLATIGEKLDQIEIRSDRQEWAKLYEEYKQQQEKADTARNKLDKFVFDNIK